MAKINFKLFNGQVEIKDFKNYVEMNNYLKRYLSKISSFSAEGNTEYYAVSGKELKQTILPEFYYLKTEDWQIENNSHLFKFDTIRDDCFFIAYQYKTPKLKLFASYEASQYKSLTHDFLMNTEVLQWY